MLGNTKILEFVVDPSSGKRTPQNDYDCCGQTHTELDPVTSPRAIYTPRRTDWLSVSY